MLKLRNNVNMHLGSHGAFDSLPAPVKTVVFDLAIQYGPNFLDDHDEFRGRLQEGILEGMINELKDYKDSFPERRNLEAKELEKLLQSWQS